MPLDRNHIDPIAENDGGIVFGMIRPPGVVIPCSLTPDALLAVAGGDRDRPQRTFIAHRDRIEAVASEKYDRGQIDADGSITLSATDFRQEKTGTGLREGSHLIARRSG